MKHKFRSWNEHYKMFIYFQHGYYFKDIGGKYIVLSNIDVIAEFWSNAEQGIDVKEENNKPIFLNDRLHVIITFGANVKASCDEEGTCFNGILKQDNIGFYIYLEKEDKKYIFMNLKMGTELLIFLLAILTKTLNSWSNTNAKL